MYIKWTYSNTVFQDQGHFGLVESQVYPKYTHYTFKVLAFFCHKCQIPNNMYNMFFF